MKPRMSEDAVRKSLADWERKLAFRRRKHEFYHHKSKRPEKERKELAQKWHRLVQDAQGMVEQREKELKWYREHRPTPPREKAVKHALHFAGKVTERPPGSNQGGIITTWELRTAAGGTWLVGQPWCGTFCWNMLYFAGVKHLDPQMPSVAAIEANARAKRHCYRGWNSGANKSGVHRGDLVVLFGQGVHVEIVVEVTAAGVWTVGGNTSSGPLGSQSNGGGVFKRFRNNADIHGFALIDYPGG